MPPSFLLDAQPALLGPTDDLVEVVLAAPAAASR
jgi:hypothetical protein